MLEIKITNSNMMRRDFIQANVKVLSHLPEGEASTVG